METNGMDMNFGRPENLGTPANENKKWSSSEAAAEIGLLRQQAAQEGATDSEPGEYTALIIKLHNNQIEPQEAVAKARAIAEKRQNYH